MIGRNAAGVGRGSVWRAAVVLVPALALAACAAQSGSPASGQVVRDTSQQGAHGASTVQTPSASPTTAPADALGTISGDVVAGPTCPVESIENPCPPKPVPDRAVSIQTPAGAEVEHTVTDANGHFTVRVAAGAYVVRVATGPGKLGLEQTTPGDVTVRAGQTSLIQIELDTGIR
jgi:hypothetical protein